MHTNAYTYVGEGRVVVWRDREIVLGLLKGTARQRKEKKDEDTAFAVEAPGPGEASTLRLM